MLQPLLVFVFQFCVAIAVFQDVAAVVEQEDWRQNLSNFPSDADIAEPDEFIGDLLTREDPAQESDVMV